MRPLPSLLLHADTQVPCKPFKVFCILEHIEFLGRAARPSLCLHWLPPTIAGDRYVSDLTSFGPIGDYETLGHWVQTGLLNAAFRSYSLGSW